MDRFVPTVGFVLGGLGVAASLAPWTDAFAIAGAGNAPGLVAALLATVAFGARRQGVEDRRLSLLGTLGDGGLALAATVALLLPAVRGTAGPVGLGLPVAFVLGIVGVGVGVADWLRLDREPFLERAGASLAALWIGVAGLLGGYLVAMAGLLVVRPDAVVLQQGLSTVLFSLGLGAVALGTLHTRGRGLAFLDVRVPDRRGWLYAIGGVIGMYVVLVGVGALATALGLPSAQHSFVEAARDTPVLLLVFVPLSWLVIGPSEEVLSRNVIQKSLYGHFSRTSAVLVATAVFTVIHLPAYWTGGGAAVFATLLRLFAISLVLGAVYERTDNVVVAALVHGTYNAIQFALAYLAVTGGAA
ncbi:MAG: lysostaphin resistance A-like protein [Halanaeroarchaeum sp.]